MIRRVAQVSVLVGLLGLAACQGKDVPDTHESKPSTGSLTHAPSEPAAVAVAAAPEAAIAPSPEALTQDQFVALMTKAVESMECSNHWMRAAHMPELGGGERFIDAGVADEMHAVVLRLAPDKLAWLNGMRAPKDAGERANQDFSALSMAKDPPAPRERQVETVAWMAYFLNRVAQDNCTPDPELLHRIDKQP